MSDFQSRCEKLIHTYKENGQFWVSKNGTINLGKDPDKPLFSCFSFYPPKDSEELVAYIKENYKYHFPEELLKFYSFSNGVKMFTAKIAFPEVTYLAHSCLDVFGFSDRSPEGCPFDIRIEDLGRGKTIPKQWLKCGSYSEPPFFDIDYDIYIDLDGRVYLTKKRESEIIWKYDSFESCFCSLFDTLAQKDFTTIYPSPSDWSDMYFKRKKKKKG